ncbi:MAG: cell division protein FtsA, partial [Bacteriovoracaceae bacterium]|nr:cell division protein FtsA [Bacteriovoracaceae bacterium]
NYSCVLVGGGALMAGLSELTEYILERPVRLGYPLCFESLPKILQSPEYATVLGLIKEAEMRDAHTFIEDEEESKIETQESFSFKNIFKEIF